MSSRTHTQTFNVATTVVGPQIAVSLESMLVSATTIAVIVTSGAATFSVEVTLDDVNDTTVTPRWLTLTDFPVGSTTTKYAGFVNPFAFARINIAAISGGVEFKILQSYNDL